MDHVRFLDLVPHVWSRGGRLERYDEHLKGKQVGGRNYKVDLDGYNQLDLLTGKADLGPS